MQLFPASHYGIISSVENSVLFETSRPDAENKYSYLFLHPVRVLQATTLDQIPALFEQIEQCLRQGWFVAGFFGYECGYGLEPALRKYFPGPSDFPLAWFGVYQRPFVFDPASGDFGPELLPQMQNLSSLGDPAKETCRVSHCRLAISRDDYCAKVEAVRDYIAAGDTYQVNLTSKVRFDFEGSPAALFAQLRDQQRVPYAAFLNLGKWKILSLSPELFLRIRDRHIVTRPMKGTAPRGLNLCDDLRLQSWLHTDPKNRSENVMIVDLLRNDLGRIAEIGSIRAAHLFAVEKYETLFQMTSTVSGTLRQGTPLLEIFRATFPCGSVTGAPKVRTMQIIRELEPAPRGVYTGSIGYFAPNGDAVFNVAIRTVVLNGNSGEMGVGGGIVFDSRPAQEYEECQLKAQFLTMPQPKFELLESLLWDGSYRFLDLHLERMQVFGRVFRFCLRRRRASFATGAQPSHLNPGSAYKVRVLLARQGGIRIENAVLEPAHNTRERWFSLRTKSLPATGFSITKRPIGISYEREYAEARRQGHEDVVFTNERGEITEGTRNNVFIEIGTALFTPPVTCGLLPGVFRRHLLETDPRAAERILSVTDLRSAGAIYLCNSVKGCGESRLSAKLDSRNRQLTTASLLRRNRFLLAFQCRVQVCQASVAHFTRTGNSETPENTASLPSASGRRSPHRR